MTTDRLRVLFCTLEYPPVPTGGAERQAQLQAEELVRRGHHVEIVCQRTGGARSGMVNGIRVHRLPRIDRRPFRTISYLAMLAMFLGVRLRRFDLVHVHLANAQADVAVLMAKMLSRPSYIKLAAGGPLGEIGRFRQVARVTRYFGIRHADIVQAISREISDDVRRIGVAEPRIRCIPNGVRISDRPEATRARARERLGFRKDEIIALYIGRLERDKGIEDLLGAWRQTDDEGSRLILIGTPGIKGPVDVGQLPPGVEYRGWVPISEVANYLAASDIFVLPSHAEGMSNALLEAMSTGVACVATRVGAAEEMLHHGKTGLLVEPRDVDGLAGAIRRLCGDRESRERMSAAASDWVKQQYNIESVVHRTLEAYRSIVAP